MWPFWKFTFLMLICWSFKCFRGKQTSVDRLKIKELVSGVVYDPAQTRTRFALNHMHGMFVYSKTLWGHTRDPGTKNVYVYFCCPVCAVFKSRCRQGAGNKHTKNHTHTRWDSCTSTGMHTEGSSEPTIQWKWSPALRPEPADAYLLRTLKTPDCTQIQMLNIVIDQTTDGLHRQRHTGMFLLA